MARTDTLPNYLNDVADAIRAKKGTSADIVASSFDTEIASIDNTPTYNMGSYITSTGTQYIDTGIRGAHDIAIEVVFATKKTGSEYLFGAEMGWAGNAYTGISFASGNFGYEYNNAANTDLATALTADKKYHFEMKGVLSGAGSARILAADVSLTAALFDAGGNIYLFACNRNGTATQLGQFRLYSCRIWDNNVLVRDFIPCSDANNVVCLFDLVSNSYFYNQGTGNFTLTTTY